MSAPIAIYGIHPVAELLRARRRPLIVLYTTDPQPKAWKQIATHLPQTADVRAVSKEHLLRLAGSADHQGVVALTKDLPMRKIMFSPSKHPYLVMIDGVQDVRNLGAILRTAYCAGVSGVMLTSSRTAPFHGAALKASAGLAEHLDILMVSSAGAGADMLLKAGYTLYVTALGGTPLPQITFKAPVCIVIGSEGQGVSPQLLTRGTSIMIPQSEPSISYNASVAAGIVLYSAGCALGAIK